MMSLVEISLGPAVKRLYLFKLRSYANLFVALVVAQTIALLFTVGGMTGVTSGIGWDNMNIQVRFYSGSGIFIFTLLWILIISILITLPPYRNIDFSFVTNRISSNLANIGFLITASVAGGITASLGSLLVRNIFHYCSRAELLIGNDFWVGPGDLISSMVVGMFYLLLLGAAGYLFGTLIQLHSSLVMILPALVIGIFFYEAANQQVRIFRAVDFYTLERSPFLFLLKTLVSLVLIWALSIFVSNRKEIR